MRSRRRTVVCSRARSRNATNSAQQEECIRTAELEGLAMAEQSIVDVVEQKRLNDARESGVPWKKWGPYLSERQWGTVREDYSQDGNAWDYFSHDQSRSRAYH